MVSLVLFAVVEPAVAADRDTDKDWKAKWERVLRDAKAEGKVVVLGPPLQDVRPSLVSGFKKSFPDVSLEYQTTDFGSLILKLRAEMAKGKASTDVVLGGTQP